MADATPEAIAKWAERKAKPPCRPKYRRMTDADRVLVMQLAKDGLTQAEIGQRLGFTQQAISEWLSKCQDTTGESSLYLRGQALRMARNIVQRGLARDHVAALKGIKVLEEDKSNQAINITVNGLGLIGMGLSPGSAPAQSETINIPQQMLGQSDN